MARVLAEIGLNHRAGDVVGETRFHSQCQIGQGINDLVELALVEAFRPLGGAGEKDSIERLTVNRRKVAGKGRPGRGLEFRGFVRHDPGRIVGQALRTQVVEKKEVVLAAAVQPPMQSQQAPAAHEVDRAAQILLTAHHRALARFGFDGAGARAPEVGMRAIAGMQRAHAHHGPLHREAGVVDPPAEAGQLFLQRQALHAALHEPQGQVVEIERPCLRPV